MATGSQPSARSTSRVSAFLLLAGNSTGIGRAGLGPTTADAILVT